MKSKMRMRLCLLLTLLTLASAVALNVFADNGVLSGDVNGNGTVDSKDLVLLRRYFAFYDYDEGTSDIINVGPGADVNGDGAVKANDVVALREYLVNHGIENPGDSETDDGNTVNPVTLTKIEDAFPDVNEYENVFVRENFKSGLIISEILFAILP